jgi:hypothetical protein
MPSLRLSAIAGRQIDLRITRFSPDGRYLAFATGETIRLWETSTGRPKRTITGPVARVSPPGSQTANLQASGFVSSLDFSPFGDTLAAGYQNGVQLWETDTGKRLGTLAIPAHAVMDVRFGPDGNRIGTCTGDSLFQIWDWKTETELHRLDTKLLTGNAGCTLAFSQDGKFLATSSSLVNSIQTWDVSSGRTLSSFETTQGGAFHLASDMRNGAFAAVGNFGVKLWKRDIKQEPQILPGHTAWVYGASFSADGALLATGSSDNTARIWDVATGKEKQKFEGSPASPSFSLDNRWLLSNGRGAAVLWDLRTGEKKVEIISGRRDWLVVTPDGLFDGSPGAWNAVMWRFENSRLLDVLPAESFFNDYYRPGLLGDILNGAEIPSPRPMASLDRRQASLKFSLSGTPATGPVSLRTIRLELDVETAPAQGSFTSSSGARDVRVFRNGALIQAFHGEIGSSKLHFQAPIVAGPNVFTAYVFNDADVKSRDALFRVVGADTLKRRGTAYIVAMGVNQYANTNYNLRYAAQDAHEFADELKRSLSQLDTFAEVRVVSLVDTDATKANLMDALHKLGGAIAVSEHAPEFVRSLPAAQPEDVVLVYFAGHGTAAKSHFYLIPHDLGYEGNRDQLNEANLNLILEHSVSDNDLRAAFENIDARKLVLIIDACNSGQALEADEKRRGPMNSKGLAQLAYEKGMYVLTASQSYQAALEGEKLGHGLLTYALVQEGLKTPAAETNSPSGELELRDWLEFAAQRVPELKSDLDIQSRLLKHERDKADPELDTSSQQPRLFYRQEPDAEPLIIARIPARQ